MHPTSRRVGQGMRGEFGRVIVYSNSIRGRGVFGPGRPTRGRWAARGFLSLVGEQSNIPVVHIPSQ